MARYLYFFLCNTENNVLDNLYNVTEVMTCFLSNKIVIFQCETILGVNALTGVKVYVH